MAESGEANGGFFGLDLSSEVVLSYHELVGWLKGYK
jgi:hypothetical protein